MPPTDPRLLLISNSTSHGGAYLGHCEAALRAFLDGVGRVLFVPFALYDVDGYAAKARDRFAELGIDLTSVHEAADPRRAAEEAQGFFVGGGNTFRLFARLYELELLEPIRRRVETGAPYVGASAGSNLACPTIKTTNDMPIVQPPSFDALGLVSFQLNPHYLDPAPASTHMGETREERIREFHEENEAPVVGLREGGMLRVEGDRITLEGAGARIFRRGQAPEEAAPGERLEGRLG